jgi:subtilisin family serine protease
VVINMSLGGSRLDAIEKAAIDYAIANGVIVVAAAGNEGDAGMSYPGAYEPVISVAASGWTGEWTPNSAWWRTKDVAEPTAAGAFYITDFSSREKQGQDLDIAAPGSWVVGPYQVQSGSTSFFFLGGTSMASPHVAGIAALMLEKSPALNQIQVEYILESTAIALPAGCRDVVDPSVGPTTYCWGADAAGAGLATADAALAALGGSGSRRR